MPDAPLRCDGGGPAQSREPSGAHLLGRYSFGLLDMACKYADVARAHARPDLACAWRLCDGAPMNDPG